MTPTPSINGMTDQQLIEAVATEVMGWHRKPWDWRQDGDTFKWANENDWIDASGMWNPLTDWNHTMEVVQRMRDIGDEREGKPWFMLRNWCDAWWASFEEGGDEIEQIN